MFIDERNAFKNVKSPIEESVYDFYDRDVQEIEKRALKSYRTEDQ